MFALLLLLGDQNLDRLNDLAGEWVTKTGDVRVSYEWVANKSALVETFVTASGKKTLTIFHADGDKLMATHYCGQGNQPRLVADPKKLVFEFKDATNLAKPTDSHLQRLELQIRPDELVKVETYREGGRDAAETLKFARVKR